jgi:hypothetical protein
MQEFINIGIIMVIVVGVIALMDILFPDKKD